ncbi:FtsK/SpoIIIE domain-containing protein [Candidatus Uabimicrobium amorphum]|uniref:ATP-binding protein n=1 Tax=Uabimicrobium amorphum TaxID=2596890 RepID=A0A5S9IS86_UABAM|nr:FtsK/SpoIIIE domain-containing protein [Candidatus Uabimicrobium amorphum]BBM87198.1 ATP-binding protein [Candidatus Uabimicrobium amorphum]
MAEKQLLQKFRELLQKLNATKQLIEQQHSDILSNNLHSIPDMGIAKDEATASQVEQQIQQLRDMVLASPALTFTAAENSSKKEQTQTPQSQPQSQTQTQSQPQQDPLRKYEENKEHLLQCIGDDQYGVCPWERRDVWDNYTPLQEFDSLPLTRVGTEEISHSDETITIPLSLDILGNKNVLIKSQQYATAIDTLQNISLRLLVSLPPARLRFLMIDPVGVGSNFAGFMHLPEEAVSGKIWSDPQKIEERLGELCEHMENIIQKYLLNQYKSMEEYNEAAAEVAEPYRVVVVANFPTNFSTYAAQRLLSLAQNGPKSGMYVIIHLDPSKKMPHNFSSEDLEKVCHVFCDKKSKNETVIVQQGKKTKISLESPPPPQRFNDIVHKVKETYNAASHVTVPYEKFVARLYPQWWQKDSRNHVQIPIGKSGRNELYFSVGKGLTHHALMVGKTGSGKSTLLNILILGAAIAYSPEEIQLYLIDFKEGVEFKKYADPILPHAKVIAIQSEREFGISVLKGLDEELTYRGDELFRPHKVKNITEYRNKQGKSLPRILLVVDEFQEFFTEEDQLAMQARNILERLVRKGRSAGIHIVLSSQSLSGSGSLPLAITNQIAIRIALQCSDGDSRSILGDNNPAAKHLSRPGEGIYNDANGLVEGNSVFQTFWLEDHIMEEYLQKIHNEAPFRCETVLFEGDTLANIIDNKSLQKVLESSEVDRSKIKIWLGQPIAMKDEHTHILLQQQTGANILFMGQNEERILGIFLSAMLSVMAQSCPQKTKFYIINLGTTDTAWQSALDVVVSSKNSPFSLMKMEKNRRACVEMVNEIHAIVDERLQQETMERNDEKVYLFFIGLQRARDLYAPDSWSPPEETKKFTTILEEGPDVGVHSFIHCDTKANMNKILSQSLKEFDIRVTLQMNAMDSSAILDSILASKLDANRAVVYNEEHSAELEKFCPYEFPNKKWIETLFDKLGTNHDNI